MKVLVLGFAKSGKGATKLLLKNNINVEVYTTNIVPYEDRDEFIFELQNQNINYKNLSLNFINEIQDGYDYAVASPAFRMDNPVMQKLNKEGVPIISEIELGYMYCKNIIAVTGTNGKSTTTKLIENMMLHYGIDAVSCGNFGKSFCEEIVKNPSRLFIVEVSCFQLETIQKFAPKAVVITNITKDHLDRYKDFEEYKNTKKLILKNITSEKIIANYDDKNVVDITVDFTDNTMYFSTKNNTNGAYLKNGNIYYKYNGNEVDLISTQDLYIDYPFEIENCLAVITLGLTLGIPICNIIETVKYFDGLKYRLEYVREYNGKKYYNNSKCTNVASCLASVKSIKEDCLLILGGSSKNECFDELFDNLPNNVKKIAICGDNAESIIENSKKYNSICKIYPNLESILENTKDLIDVKVVLYSPSSASFDNYTSSTNRGEIFCKLVSEIK